MDTSALRVRVLAPLAGGVIALALTFLARDLFGTQLLAELVVDASTQVLQPRGFSTLLSAFGSDGKPLLFAGVLLGQLAIYLVAWQSSARFSDQAVLQALAAAAFSCAVLLIASAGLVGLTEASFGSSSDWVAYGSVAAVSSFGFAGVAWLMATSPDALEGPSDSRRDFLMRFPALVLAAGAAAVVIRRVSFSTGGGVQLDTRGQPTPDVTPNEAFYVVSKNLVDPEVNASRWRLRVGGVTGRMLELTYDELLTLPAVEQYTTFQCISNQVGGPLMGNALWRGVRLRDLLDRVDAQPAATHVLFRSEDDYVESLPLDVATSDGVILAHTMNGEPLPDKHGFPLRLVAPGRYGMNQPKWITEVVLADRDMLGYWGRRAWSPRAPMQTSSRIDVPAPDAVIEGTVRIHGVAFSGDRGISRVEVSTDGGKAWHEAMLKPALSPYTWVLWYYDWKDAPAAGGRTTLLARATDGAGDLQSAIERPPYPAGATGLPRVGVRIGAARV